MTSLRRRPSRWPLLNSGHAQHRTAAPAPGRHARTAASAEGKPRRRHPAGRLGQVAELARHRPGQHGRPHHRLAVYEADPTIYYAATASGGLLKTTNNGITFQHQFDKERTVSIGDVCVAPSNPNIVWVGTGEANPRKASPTATRVYKSTDGRPHLEEHGPQRDFPDRRIAIHPKNPEIVYVGASAGSTAPTRSAPVSRRPTAARTGSESSTTDDNTGVIDLKMHPTDPDTLLVALWERRRDGSTPTSANRCPTE